MHIHGKQFPKQPAERLRIHRSQYLKHMVIGQFLANVEGNALIQQA